MADNEMFHGQNAPEKRLICMMGLPRSGKSTVARFLSKKLGAPVVNRDSIRLALHGQRFAKSAEPMVKAIAGVMVNALFAYHDRVIVDETNLKAGTREFWIDMGYPTEFLNVMTPKEVCLARAQSMDDDEIQPVIEAMAEYDDREEYVHPWVLVHSNTELAEVLKRAETETPVEPKLNEAMVKIHEEYGDMLQRLADGDKEGDDA